MMQVLDVIKISYCRQHKLYWIWNCPACMEDEVETKTLKAVGEWLEKQPWTASYTVTRAVQQTDVELLKQGKRCWRE